MRSLTLLLTTAFLAMTRRFCTADDDMVAKLAGALSGPDVEMQIKAAKALGRYGAKASAAVPGLVHGIAVGQPRTQTRPPRTRSAPSDPAAKDAVAALAATLEDRDAGVRAAAADALGRLGTVAQSAAPALIKGVLDSDQRSAASAAMPCVASMHRVRRSCR